MATRSNAPSVNATPLITPTRKAPQCSICKRPRAGHPRSGCPYADSPATDDSRGADTGHLSDALGSMVIASPLPLERDEDKKAFTRNRRRKSATPRGLPPSTSFLSLSTDSHDIIQRLSQPGILNTPRHEYGPAAGGKPTRIVRWQEAVQEIRSSAQPNIKTKSIHGRPLLPGSIMPGTLIPPTPEGSFVSPSKSACNPKLESPSQSEGDMTDPEDAEQEEPLSGSMSTISTRRPQPLERTMSSLERNTFVAQLDSEAPATIHLVPKVDIATIAQRAMDLKFIVHQVMSDNDDDEQALLILGRDEKTVQSLVDKVETENQKAAQSKQPQTPEKGRSALKTAAGAAVVGAVGAWVGLAFS
ncbi:hypothetical protein D9619_000692 [Psilocybe cf. subviscida]|uniref:Uncharacterized protein n=1 Tax=Psilocybe cf. subviscida TaxID=2480587 RepID=A0A8H5F372_9AGAR|nr:hypothetical protein D9619_000692 [Psilocybe cf. subviscida]